MIIEKYGIKLVSLKEEDIELVRTKRNDPNIQKKMFFQKNISKQDQINWFKAIDGEREFYFVLHLKGEKIGLAHGRIKSFKEKVAEGGMFIWSEEYIGTYIPVLASICLTDLCFFIVGMSSSVAEVRMDNPKVIEYNLSLGYKILNRDEVLGKIKMELTKEDYINASEKIRKTIKKITKQNTDLSLEDMVEGDDCFIHKFREKIQLAAAEP